MKIKYLIVISTFLLSGSLMGQEQKPDRQDSKAMRPKRIGLTEEQMTAKMVSELELDEKQQKKVAKLNKKYKTLIEGEQMPEFNGQRPSMGQGGRPGGSPNANFGGGRPGGMGGPGSGRPDGGMPHSGMQGGPRHGMPSDAQQSSYDYDKEQQKYDKQIRKLLSDEQYEGYLNIKPQFASQRRVREFLLGGNGGVAVPPGVFGGPGSRQKDIKYAGATLLTAASTEAGKTYESSMADECALLISTKDAVAISQPTINKTGNSDGGDNCSFYGGTLTNRQGHLFHVTNTNAIITLNGVKLVNEDPTSVILSVCADGWKGAANKATFNVSRQQLEGTILVGNYIIHWRHFANRV